MQQQKIHAFKVNANSNGKKFFKLVCSDRLMCDFFDHWCLGLAKIRSYNTVKSYSDAVVVFLNYMFEVEKAKGQLNKSDLHDVLESFESYLVFGSDSDVDIASEAAKNLSSSPQGYATVSLYFTGLNNFLEKSENLRRTIHSLESRGVPTDIRASDTPLTIIDRVKTPAHIQKAVKESSWLSGCINGVMSTIKRKGLSPSVKSSTVAHTNEHGGDHLTFPIDLCSDLIKSAANLRDRTLWSLIAATGCRISEAQTMRWDDISIDVVKNEKGEFTVNKEILIIDPATRKKTLKRHLTETEISSLPHKGRADNKTYPIEPFATMFWGYFDQYKKQEMKRNKKQNISDHGFIFRLIPNTEPVINSYQTLYDSFSVAAKKLTGESYGFHSLRHMYGYYLKNFCPVRIGRKLRYGMSLKSVQSYMGHKEIVSTQRYARDDAIKLVAAHSAMNMERNRSPSFSVQDAKIGFLQNEIQRLKEEKLLLEIDNDKS
jgi:integrase/recombinase XerD